MALAQHLRADQRLRRAGSEAIENAHQRALFSRRIAIENVDDDGREIAAEALLHFLRPETDRLEHLAIALRALRWNCLAHAAVVTDQHAVAAMHGHRHAAVEASKIVSALAAQQIRCVTTSIDEDDGLLARGERLLQRGFQRMAEDH